MSEQSFVEQAEGNANHEVTNSSGGLREEIYNKQGHGDFLSQLSATLDPE